MRGVSMLCALALGCAASPPSNELYPLPWPDERLRREDGRLDLSGFPRGAGAPIRDAALDALATADGFGVASAVLFPLDGPLDPRSLPSVEASVEPGSAVFVIDVDPDSPERGRRAPIDARYLADGGPYGGTDLLVVLPYPGVPLAPDTLYAVVVTTRLRRADGARLRRSDPSSTETTAHGRAREALDELGVGEGEIADLAVIRTGDPTAGLRRAVAQALEEEPIAFEPPALVEEHADYCVYRSATAMPVYQGGEPPYLAEGGGWVRGEDGRLRVQARPRSRIWITVPRRRADTYPPAILVRAGAGGDRPLVDRGPRDADGVSTPGTGLARELAQAGYVGLSVDGPLGGARNLAGWDEQTAIFNVENPVALRDNVRQTALELVLFARALEDLEIEASGCEGASPRVGLRPEPVLIGHSTGATIAPLAAAVEPRFRALVLSGAGASWIRQIVHKRSPVRMRPVAEVLFGYWPGRALVEHDPLLSLLQWAGEPADPMVYGRRLRDRPVLVFQGVIDTYIPPPISNPLAMSLGLDLAGTPLDESQPTRSALDDLALVGGAHRDLPASLDERSRVLTQHPPDGIEDGHEVLFQRPDARRQLRCYLRSLRDGRPRLVAPAPVETACVAP